MNKSVISICIVVALLAVLAIVSANEFNFDGEMYRRMVDEFEEDMFLSESYSSISNGQQACFLPGLNMRDGPCGNVKSTTTSTITGTVSGVSKATCLGKTWTWVRIGSYWGAFETGLVSTSCGGSSGSCSISGFPTYKQCDSRWGGNALGSSSTICKVGCLMSSVSSGMAKFGKTINGNTATPATLNSFLRANGGYQGNLFVWGSVTRFGLSYQGKTKNHTTIKNAICSGRSIVVLNVNNGGHWVLATGVSGSSYIVMDPGYTKTSYGQSEVVEAAIYNA